MKNALRSLSLIASLLAATSLPAWAAPQAAPPASPKPPDKIELKDAGVPAVKTSTMTRQQFMAMQEEARQMQAKEVAAAKAGRPILQALAKDYQAQGMRLADGDQRGQFDLFAPAIAQIKDPKQRKAKLDALVATFRTRTAKVLGDKTELRIWADQGRQQRLR